MAQTSLLFNIFARNHTGPVLSGISGSFKKLGAGLGFAGVAAGIGQSINKAAEFDKTVRLAGTAAGASAEQMKGLSDTALKVGTASQFGAKGAADAMLELAKGGITVAQMKAGALTGTMTLASAGGLELGAAATYMTNTLNTFGLKASDAASVAAALAGGANASTASVESLGMALGQVGPGAKNAGLSMQETVGALAAFDNAGIKGSDAGTSLKTMLTRLVPQTDKASNAMRSLGLNFTDSQGAFVPLANVAQQLQDKLSGLSEKQRTVALSTIFGSDATRAASVLMNEGAKGIEAYTKAAADKNAADKMAKAQTAGAAGAMQKFKGAVESLQISFALHLLPAFTKVTLGAVKLIGLISSGIGPMFRWLGKKVRENQPAIDAVRDAFGRLGGFVASDVVPKIQAFVSTFKTQVWPAIQRVASIIGTNLRPAFEAWVRVVQTQVIPGVQRVGQALGVLIPPVMKVGAVLLVVASYILGKVLPVFFRLEGFLIGVFTKTIAKVVTIVAGLINTILRIGMAVGNAAAAFGRFVSAVAGAMGRARAAVVNGIANAISSIKAMPGKAVAAIGDLGSLLFQKGKDFIKGFVNGILDTAASIPGVIKDKVVGVAKSALHGFGLFGSPSRLTKKYGRWFGEGFVNGITSTESRITNTFASLIDKATTAGKKGIAKSAKVYETEMLKLAAKRDKIAQKIKDADVGKLKTDAKGYAKGIRDAFLSATDVTAGRGEGPGTFDSLIGRLTMQADRATAFTGALAKLRKLKLNRTSYDQIVAAGAEGGGLETASQILGAGKAGVRMVNGLVGTIRDAGASLGKVEADRMYGNGIKVAEGLVAGLLSQEEKVTKAMSKLAKKMVATIKSELGIKSPSRLFHRLGEFVPAGFAGGIAANSGAVTEAVAAMRGSAVAAGTPAMLAGGGVPGQRTPLFLRLEIDVVGDDEEMVRRLRKSVRIKGGNVQAVIGTG